MIQLSIIIVNYNVQYFLEQCLISVQAACKNISYEIIVVDNNSSDNSCIRTKELFFEIKLIKNNENIGFAKANNIGVEQAKGKYILILNPDTVLPENCLDEVIAFADKKKNIGAIGTRFIDGTGNFLPECKRNMPTIEIASRKLMGDSKRYYASNIGEEEISKVEVLTGAFMLIKREVYIKVGGFDEDYFMFGEDIDLSYKLLNQGFQNYYYGKTTIIHYKGESTVKDKVYLNNFYGAMQIFYKKHFKSSVISNLVLNKAIKTLILFKSKNVSKVKSKVSINSVLLISDDMDKLEKIKTKFHPVPVSIIKHLPIDVSAYDKIIFDNSLMTFKEIIFKFQELKKMHKPLRIIPNNTSFFIGSDSSREKGEVFIY